MKKNNNFEVSINNFAISTKQKPEIPDMANSTIISWTYTPSANSWNIRTVADNIRADKTYSEFAATFGECIRDLKIDDFSFYSTDIKLNSVTSYIKRDIKLNILMFNLFNMIINETDEDLDGVRYDCYDDDIVYISTCNKYWGMLYCSRRIKDTDIATTYLELKTYKPIRKGGCKPHELKKSWFKKLGQIPVIYEYLKIRKFKADEYLCMKYMMKDISLADLKAYIGKIKAAMNKYFSS